MSHVRISDLIRPSLREFKPYSSGYGETRAGRTLLHANELSSGSPVHLEGEFSALRLNRYPDPEQRALREKLGSRFGLGPANVFVGVGSDEIIDLLIRLFCEPGQDSILQAEPTYGVYQVQAALNGVAAHRVPLGPEFDLDAEILCASIRMNPPKLVFLCSPNNPTGALLDPRAILSTVEAAARVGSIVVVDQAYAEFSGLDPDPIVRELVTRSNLVCLRTLSKAWGLAGIRVGYALADSEIVGWLQRIKAPYNVSVSSAAIALAALDSPEFLSREVGRVQAERARLTQSLRTLPSIKRVHPSDSNFLLVRFTERDAAFDKLMKKGIVVRRRSDPGLEDCLRITIGTRDENDTVLQALGGTSP